MINQQESWLGWLQIGKEVRTACLDERRKLREVQEEERELKRRHRQEVVAAVRGAVAPTGAENGGGEGGVAGAAGEAKGSKANGVAANVPAARQRQIEAAEQAMATRVRNAKASCEDAVNRHEARLEQATRRLSARCVCVCVCVFTQVMPDGCLALQQHWVQVF